MKRKVYLSDSEISNIIHCLQSDTHGILKQLKKDDIHHEIVDKMEISIQENQQLIYFLENMIGDKMVNDLLKIQERL